MAARIRVRWGDRSGEIELGSGLVTPEVPGLPQDPIAPAGPDDAPRPGGGGDRVRKPHCAGSARAACNRASCGCRLTCRPRPGPAATQRGTERTGPYTAPRQSGKSAGVPAAAVAVA